MCMKQRRITSVTSSAGTTSYVYDALDQLTKETCSGWYRIYYTYDEVGNRLTITPGGATTTTYHYDNANEITNKVAPIKPMMAMEKPNE
jgi:YD repeat-containing protein